MFFVFGCGIRDSRFQPAVCRKYKELDSINYIIKVYFLHCFVQRHVSALVMSNL